MRMRDSRHSSTFVVSKTIYNVVIFGREHINRMYSNKLSTKVTADINILHTPRRSDAADDPPTATNQTDNLSRFIMVFEVR